MLFNASSVASEMDFDHEALKLASLCAHWDPKPSYVLRKSRLEDTFGMRFDLKGGALVLSQQPPMVVREEAWKTAKEMVREGPTWQCELIFSELHNIATRNRETGYVDDAIVVMEEVVDGDNVPSYAFAVLAGFYAMRGNRTWLNDYLGTVRKAIEILAAESPASTWYEHTVRDISKMAVHTEKTAEIKQILIQAGIAMPSSGPEGIDNQPSAPVDAEP